ncbi:MAG: tRNA 2-thiouridine(34) synthase MnmA [Pseudomonadota bacterium]
MNKKINVMVGMSGGVDSSVAALLLLQQGYHVEGTFMKNWEQDPGQDDNCSADQDLIDAQAVCLKLGIRLHTVNFADEYWDRVFEHFLDEHRAGRTPNPDILCNKEIKFKAFLDYALNAGANYIATGHYIRTAQQNGDVYMLKAKDLTKDQSYFLYALNQHQLRHALFPIGDYQKTTIRALAAQHGLRNHNKKDSTGICFIGERHFSRFLSQYLPAKPGDMITSDGEILGKHQGLMFYTIGQRKGLNIGGRKDSENLPWYVVDKNLKSNQLIVAQGNEHINLFKSTLYAEQLSWINKAPTAPYPCEAKIRYNQPCQACAIESIHDGRAKVVFDQAQRAITPGQSIVFYRDNYCLGGGIIQ